MKIPEPPAQSNGVATFEEEDADRTTVTLRQIHEGGRQAMTRLADYLNTARAPFL